MAIVRGLRKGHMVLLLLIVGAMRFAREIWPHQKRTHDLVQLSQIKLHRSIVRLGMLGTDLTLILYLPHAQLQVMFLYLSLHSCPRNWWSTWLQAVGWWFEVWSATMAKFVALDMQAFLFQEEIRYTNVTYTFLKDGSVSALKKRVVSSFFGEQSPEFFTLDEATWCGGMPNTWRSQCHISWPLRGIGLTWSL